MLTRTIHWHAVAFLLAVCTHLHADQPAEKVESLRDQAMAAQLEREIPEVNFTGQALSDVMDFMRDVTGANIFVDWKSLESAGVKRDAPVRLAAKNAKFKAVMTGILESTEKKKGTLQFTAEDGTLIVAAAPDPKRPPAVTVKGLPENLDRRLPEVKFDGPGLADSLDFMKDISGMKFSVDWEALKKSGITKESPIKLRVRDIKFSTALKYILQSVTDGKTPITCVYNDNTMTVTAMPKEEKTGK